MRQADCKFLRIMSYPNDADSPLAKEVWKAEVGRRLRELCIIAEGEGIVLAHENCNGYGDNPDGYLELVEEVASPALQLIIDTGNNSLHENDVEVTWNYYKACRDEISHVHVKCAKPSPEGGDYVTCHADEDPVQDRIFRDLEATGYDGWLSSNPYQSCHTCRQRRGRFRRRSSRLGGVRTEVGNAGFENLKLLDFSITFLL